VGLALNCESKNEEALDNFKKALGLNNPEIKPKAALAMADTFFKTGDYDNALKYYYKSLDGASLNDTAGLHIKLAEIQEAKGNSDAAIKEYLEAAKLSGQDQTLAAKAFFRIGQIYEDRDNPQEALNAYAKISSMNIPESGNAQERINRIKQGVK